MSVAITISGWFVLLGLALISHAAGQGLIVYALAHLPAHFSSVSLLLQPVLATIWAWILFSEGMTVMQGLGATIILCGIYLARKGSQ